MSAPQKPKTNSLPVVAPKKSPAALPPRLLAADAARDNTNVVWQPAPSRSLKNENTVVAASQSQRTVNWREENTQGTGATAKVKDGEENLSASAKNFRRWRWREALRQTLPISLAMVVGVTLILIFNLRIVSQVILEEIARAGVMKTTSLIHVGSQIIRQAPNEDDWPVQMRLISAADYRELTSDPKVRDKSEVEKNLFALNYGNLLSSYFVATPTAATEEESSLLVQFAYIYGFLPPAKNNAPLATYERDRQGRTDGLEIRANGAWMSGLSLETPMMKAMKSTCEIWPGLVAQRGGNNQLRQHAVLLFKMYIYNNADAPDGEDNQRDGDRLDGARPPTADLAASKAIGYVMLGVGADQIMIAAKQVQMRTLIVSVGIVLLVSIFYLFVGYFGTRKLEMLLLDIEQVADGNFRHTSVVARNPGLLGELARHFNAMIEKLAGAQTDEKKLAAIRTELDIAREIQVKLLPTRLPRIKGLDLFADYKPAKEVGGDYYDFFPVDHDHIGIVVADVSGKGVPGCVVMATARTVLRFIVTGRLSTADAMKRTNALVAQDIRRGMFITAYYLIYNARTRELTGSSAGHNPMVIVHANGECDKINPKGIALGFDKGKIFNRMIQEEKVQLQKGDRVVLYTDGVVEAMNLENEEYTDERFYAFCAQNAEMSSEEFVGALLADLNTHRHSRDTRKKHAEQHDDITVVTFRVM
ncbi:MAG: PP2C family protein-serine/threonine phosphatase [Planctomycetota bacterium]|jgi:serine phosphatase RsbU (regulator of sigma subunit)|nr:PP2C family protein-serine/threonine phosphatase [Planctomycetota bacterium]